MTTPQVLTDPEQLKRFNPFPVAQGATQQAPPVQSLPIPKANPATTTPDYGPGIAPPGGRVIGRGPMDEGAAKVAYGPSFGSRHSSIPESTSIGPGYDEATQTQPSPIPKARVVQPSPSATEHQAELARLTGGGLNTEEGKPGYQQIHNPFLKTIAGIGDVIAGGFFPRAAMFIPGTTAHHNMLVGGARRNVAEDTAQMDAEQKRGLEAAQQGNVESEQPLHEAQAEHLKAETEALRNPTTAENGGTVHEDAEGNYWVIHQDGSATAVKPRGGGEQVKGKVAQEKTKGTVHEDSEGNMWIVKDDGTATPVSKPEGGGQLKGKTPPAGTEIIDQDVNGEPHNVLIEKSTGKTIQDLGKKGSKPEKEGAQAGTWAIQEDSEGHPVLFNSKTAQVRQVSGVQKPGTAAKAAGPHDALNYATDYQNSKAYTGPGDEALMEKFFELAKPSTGFRMSAPQQKMLMETRDLIQGFKARAAHAFSPNAPYFDDQQRQNIVKTMQDLAKAKGIQSPQGGGAGPQPGTVEGGYRFKGGDPGKKENWEKAK